MIIQVDFYKESGKWYEGGKVDVGKAMPWVRDELEQAIVDNQQILLDGWQGEFFVVVNNTEPFDDKKDHFCMRLYAPSDFNRLKRRGKNEDQESQTHQGK